MKTVLITDDNRDIRTQLIETLQQDYYVLQAANGEEAIEILMDHTVDLITMDVNMPVTNGFEALRVIKDEDNGWPHIPVIMLTVMNEPENALKAWSIGAQAYITKPFYPPDLLAAVGRELTPETEVV